MVLEATGLGAFLTSGAILMTADIVIGGVRDKEEEILRSRVLYS